MQVFHGVQQIGQPLAGSVVTIGNFDGVHLGHQELLKTVSREAQAEGVDPIVYTFHPHPVKILYPERQTQRLFDLRDQQEQFARFGIKAVVVEPFSADFAKTSAKDFVENYLVRCLRPKTLVVGHDFSFGSQREGNLRFLEEQCRQRGIKLIIIPPMKLEGVVVSSSLIREALKNGDIASAKKYLARDYYVRGHVEQGYQRGRTIGVPTANISPDVEFIPRKGVYCTFTKVQGHFYPSITNIGINPTFAQSESGSPVKIESHLFDFNAVLYGLEVEVVLKSFIRDEKKFSDISELKHQIQLDISEAKDWFKNNG